MTGRPRKYANRVNTAIRFDADLHRRLTEFADARELSVNWIVNRAVERYLTPLPPPPVGDERTYKERTP